MCEQEGNSCACGTLCGLATVNGVIIELSPIEKRKKDDNVKYFYGKLLDNKGYTRVTHRHFFARVIHKQEVHLGDGL